MEPSVPQGGVVDIQGLSLPLVQLKLLKLMGIDLGVHTRARGLPNPQLLLGSFGQLTHRFRASAILRQGQCQGLDFAFGFGS